MQTLSRAADGGVQMRVERYRGARLVDTLMVSNDHEAGPVTAERTVVASGQRERLVVDARDGGATVVRVGGASSVPSIATASADDVLRITRRVEGLRERATIALGRGERGLQPAPGWALRFREKEHPDTSSQTRGASSFVSLRLAPDLF